MFKKVTMAVLTSFFLLTIFTLSTPEAKTILMSWDANTEPDIAGYRIYWGTTYTEVVNKTNLLVDVGNKTSVCININDADYYNNKVLFFGVTAYNTSGLESGVAVCYLLQGNIIGDHNDGTPYPSARVDGFDLNALGLHFGKIVTHPSYDCNSEFVIQPETEEQRCDLNHDGRIDGFDLIILGLFWGNTVNP